MKTKSSLSTSAFSSFIISQILKTKFYLLWTQTSRNWIKLFTWTCYFSQISHALNDWTKTQIPRQFVLWQIIFSNKDEDCKWSKFHFRQVCAPLAPVCLPLFFILIFFCYKQSDGIFLWTRATKREDNPTVDNTHSEYMFCPEDKLRRPLNGRFLLWRSLLLRQSPEAGRFTSRVLASFILPSYCANPYSLRDNVKDPRMILWSSVDRSLTRKAWEFSTCGEEFSIGELEILKSLSLKTRTIIVTIMTDFDCRIII